MSNDERQGPHSQMNLARRHVGSQYLKRIVNSPKGRGTFLRLVADAINSELTRIGRAPDLEIRKMYKALMDFPIDPEGHIFTPLNESLISKIEELAKDLN